MKIKKSGIVLLSTVLAAGMLWLIFASKQTPAAASKTEAKPRKVSSACTEQLLIEEVSPADAAQLKEKARTLLKKRTRTLNWKEGYDPEKKSIVTIGTADFKINDPASNETFFVMREMALKTAVLNARIALFRHIDQDIPATDRSNLPGTAPGRPMALHLIASKIIAQAESWDQENQKFQVAVMLGWNFESAHLAHAIVTGKEFKETPAPDAATIQEWLETQDISQLTGPRQYLDKNGERWFLGTAVRAYGDKLKEPVKIKNQMMAEMFAKQMAVSSVFAAISKTDRGIVQTVSVSSIVGLQLLYRNEITCSMTGQKIYAAVYAISAEDVKAAFQAEKSEK